MAKDFVKLKLKDTDFTFTALDFGQLQELDAQFEVLKGLSGGMPTAEQRTAIVEVVHASLIGKQPDLTTDQLARMLTLANIEDALKAVAGQSGLKMGDQSGNA